MTHTPLRAAGLLAFAVGISPLACSKKPPPPPAEEAASTPTPAASPEVLELAPLVEDSGAEAVTDAAPKKWIGTRGGGMNANQLKIQACCGAMRSQAKTMGASSPEGFQMNALAAQCDVFAKQVGPAGNAPELNQVRQVLKSVKLPAACSF